MNYVLFLAKNHITADHQLVVFVSAQNQTEIKCYIEMAAIGAQTWWT